MRTRGRAVRRKLGDCRPTFAGPLKRESPKSNERLGQNLSAGRTQINRDRGGAAMLWLANGGLSEEGEFALWRATRLRAGGARDGSDQVTAPIKLEHIAEIGLRLT